MLLLAPALADTALEKIALYSSLEEFLGYGNDYAVDFGIIAI